ncbi:SnoaL-like domain-containing protein [Nitrosomonas sp. PY1]|uniref:nuclear transport factor 2 family protein n=1 Tax=Nitrosomonas sp. PY1 TaxID=1803906 RepID=UPI001FC84B14|nr:nuclear transport factor 2 family protein [Nitrosomonas sp. PY1]GKS68026.1 SnoaL-like domain-containing protein [Nitrosomonas sp. PY1]
MNNQEYIERAQRYVQLSNQGDLTQIQRMFASHAVYYSAYFGEYVGNQSIHDMMCEFFGRFQDAHWQVEEYRCIEERGVEFDFVMTGTNISTGESVERYGLEKIFFTAAGLIEKIVVCKAKKPHFKQ